MAISNRQDRPYEGAQLHGEFRLAVTSGLITVVDARTASAGHLFVMRNPSTTKKMLLRYLKATYVSTTAMGTAQPMGYDLFIGRTWTASHSGGTAIDMGSTITTTNKTRVGQSTSMFTVDTCRMATTLGLTAGTVTAPDANPLSAGYFLSPALGAVGEVVLWDSRDDGAAAVRAPLTIGTNEGIIVRNIILMGGTGVGNFTVNVEWDEVT